MGGGWFGGVGTVYAGEKILKAVHDRGERVHKNNQLKLEREKFAHQKSQDTTRLQMEITENYQNGQYSESTYKDLISQSKEPIILYEQASKKTAEKSVKKVNKPPIGSVTLSNHNSRLNKDYKSEVGDEKFYNLYKPKPFETLEPLSLIDILKIVLISVLFGLVVRFVVTKLVQLIYDQIEIAKKRNTVMDEDQIKSLRQKFEKRQQENLKNQNEN